jgi:hypothetical protein
VATNPSVLGITAMYVVVSVSTFLWLVRHRSERDRRLLWPMGLNAAAAIAILFLAVLFRSSLFSISPFGISRQELYLIVLLTLVFAIFVEVPGFFLNVDYDRKKGEALQKLADALLDVRFSPTHSNRERLHSLAERHRRMLGDSHLGDFLAKCASELAKLPNADMSLVNVLLEQVEREQVRVSDQSKHPFPILIQLFSLSALAFVLAEILAILRTK